VTGVNQMLISVLTFTLGVVSMVAGANLRNRGIKKVLINRVNENRLHYAI